MPRLNKCPETDRDLTDIDPRKHAMNLWPEVHRNPQAFDGTEAHKRYTALIEEADARDAEREDQRVAARKEKKH